MKTLIFSDEVNLFHWTVLKSVLLILSLLPVSQFFMNIWQGADANSQIMIGFLAISMFSALSIISFYSALNATVMQLKSEYASLMEQYAVKVYRYIPMLFLSSILSYLAIQL